MYVDANVAAGLADHWIDLVLAALLSIAGYLADARLRSIEERCSKIEAELKEIRAEISHICERIARIEVVRELHQ